ncbi:hypothetical protein BC827DRAFT_1268088 [Russula dissimulans]|nr:hypothetical protein BC827DRAFT_1268088 [Russula dissimulans]
MSVKTGRWGGVVTAFITMSNIKDEIDWEFPGPNTTTGQTNYFWRGNIRVSTTGISDTRTNYHAYTVRASSCYNVVRTVNKTDTVDEWRCPLPNNPIVHPNQSLAGERQLTLSTGHFYALVKSVDVQCSDPTPPGPNITSYTYGANSSDMTPTVAFSN